MIHDRGVDESNFLDLRGGDESDFLDLEDQNQDGDFPPAQARYVWYI